MGKMHRALLLVFVIEVVIILLEGPTYTTTALYDFLSSPFNWSQTGFYIFILVALITAGGIAIVSGSFFTSRDWIWRGVLVATFITFGAIIAVDLFKFISKQAILSDASSIIASIFVGPLVLYFIMACIDFVSGKD